MILSLFSGKGKYRLQRSVCLLNMFPPQFKKNVISLMENCEQKYDFSHLHKTEKERKQEEKVKVEYSFGLTDHIPPLLLWK